MIAIVDYGLGNLGSVQNMFRKIGVESVVTSDPNVIDEATKVILPGVGSFDAGMGQIRKSDLEGVLHHKAIIEKVPVLGICLGAQLMTKSSEEGIESGLGWFDANTLKFDHTKIPGRWPLPNIGWRDVQPHNDYPLLDGIDGIPRFYFVHSFLLRANDPAIIALSAEYGYTYSCGLRRDNLYCVQFHPEKSHRFGAKFLANFAKLN